MLSISALTISSLSCHQLPQRTSTSSENDSPTSSTPSTPPPPPPEEAFLGKISPSVLAKISHMPVMAPAYVPSGFVLADYRFEGARSYDLIYRNSDNLCFAIEYRLQEPPTADLAGLDIQTFSSPLFGQNRKLYYRNLSPKAPNQPGQPSQLFSQWLSNNSGSYRFAGSEIVGQNYPNQTLCQNVSLIEASQIISSIADIEASFGN